MSDASSVGAVVVTHDPDVRRLDLSLSSLVDQAGRVVMVDNGSANLEEVEALAAKYPAVDVLPLGENRGIAAGFNAGVKELADKGGLPPWVLTTDQDSVLHEGAVEALFASLERLEEVVRGRCGIVAARWQHPVPSKRWLSRRAARAIDLGRVGDFEKRLFVISSGNLVRREVLAEVAYEDDLFIDCVDHAFCAEARRRDWLVLESNALLMEHRLGSRLEYRGRERNYENAQRLYYISRNTMLLLMRHDFPPSVYLASLIWWSRAYVARHGPRSALACALILSLGAFDGISGRLGKRDYRFLAREGLRPAVR